MTSDHDERTSRGSKEGSEQGRWGEPWWSGEDVMMLREQGREEACRGNERRLKSWE